jgi:cystathionine beta-lyase/cystathionine gamma-synthase
MTEGFFRVSAGCEPTDALCDAFAAAVAAAT